MCRQLQTDTQLPTTALYNFPSLYLNSKRDTLG